jgi:uncharacterized protein (TIGR03435 family)
VRTGLLTAFLVPALSLAQDAQPAPRFEVASIKPNLSETHRFQMPEFAQGGRLTFTDATLVDMIVQAYSTRRIQMEGGPGWIDSDHFDVVAKADVSAGGVKTPQMRLMLRSLLEERFQLKLHTEMKEENVLTLVVAKAVPLVECKDDHAKTELVRGENLQMTFHKMHIVGLVNTMANILHTPVMDGTGLTGYYDFTIDPNRFRSDDASDPGHKDSFADLVVAAVREQLGLRLEKKKAPLEITIVDRAEHPSAN